MMIILMITFLQLFNIESEEEPDAANADDEAAEQNLSGSDFEDEKEDEDEQEIEWEQWIL